jgi:CRISPR-associated protein Cmr2
VTDSERLYFNIGPVQSFVAQARRTRDLWAGSFLLSHLSQAALTEVKKHGGSILLPARDHASKARGEASQPFGTVPNRFVAKDVDAGGARAAADAVRRAWAGIAQAVWDRFVAPVASLGNDTRGIWDRQVAHFWEITWVIGPPGCLEARKQWRTPPLRVEGGDHCAVMGDLQELSGYVRAQDRCRQNEFWAAVRGRCNTLELADDERMCAIALIKRLFPAVAKETVKIEFPVQSWPSSSYLAAVPWLERVASRQPGDDEQRSRHRDAMRYAEQVHALAPGAGGERYTRIACLRRLGSRDSKFLCLHGNFFFKEQLRNARRTPFATPEPEGDTRRRELVGELEVLHKAVGEPGPYFALLMMDGDSMGKLLALAHERAGEGLGEAVVPRSLQAFADAAPDLVAQNNGVTVYAGGDDVVALLPAQYALACAAALAQLYRECFVQHCAAAQARDATLSGAIVYAHYSTPLRQILTTAHRLLDDVAKDATGRDSLAIGVLKGDALVCEWSAPWAHLHDGKGTDRAHLLDELIKAFTPDKAARARELSSSFLFGLRAWVTGLCADAREVPGQFGRLPGGLAREDKSDQREKGADYLHALLVAEYLRARAASEERDVPGEGERAEQQKQRREQAGALMRKLLRVCRRTWREPSTAPDTEAKILTDEHSFGFDGPYLIRFLALEIYEEET